MTLKRSAPITRTPMRFKASPNQPTKAQRLAIWTRDEGKCARCGRWVSFDRCEIHHRLLRAQGPDNRPCNLVTLCSARSYDAGIGCHEKVHDRRLTLGEPFGWIVPSHGDPAAIPIQHHDLGRVWLGADGGYRTADDHG